MQFDVVLEQDPETGVWLAEAVGVPGAYTQGRSREEALKNIREVLQLIRDSGGLPSRLHVEFVRIEA